MAILISAMVVNLRMANRPLAGWLADATISDFPNDPERVKIIRLNWYL